MQQNAESKEVIISNAGRGYVDTKKLASYLDVSIHTVRAWIWHKRVEDFIIRAGRLVRFDLTKIQNYIQENGVFPPEIP